MDVTAVGAAPSTRWRELNRPDVAGWVAAGTLAVGGAGALCQRVLHVGPRGCVLRAAIGLPCPLCGLSTVGVKLARLDLVGAIRHDLLGVALIAVLLAMAVSVVVRLRLVRLPRPSGAWAWGVPVAVLTAHWIATLSGAVTLAPLR